MRLLILGGTTEASLMAKTLAEQGIDAVFSYAGRTDAPVAQPLPTRVGGFGGKANQLSAIGDNDRVTQNVQAVFPLAQLERLRHGLSLDGKPLKPAKVEWQNPEQLRFVLTEGKKRQIRRMCEQVGLHVVGLKRVRMGRVTLGQLPLGQWRYLRPDEKF